MTSAVEAGAPDATRSFTEELRGRFDASWGQLVEHPFVREMAAGTLPLEKFRFYVEQNLLYLPQYARAIALAAGKARDDDELRAFTASLVNIVDVEIPQNLRLCEQVRGLVGTDEPRATEMAPGALAYTSYLLATAGIGGPLDILTLIMPCAWSYGDIAASLAPGMQQHAVYSDWITFFASADYQQLVARMRTQLDADVASRSERERNRLASIFHTAIRMEKGFWDMSYRMETWS